MGIFAIFVTPAHAGLTEEQAVREYIRPRIQRYLEDRLFEWQKTGNGGYLIRASADVTGDGKPEVFLTSLLCTEEEPFEWSVYRQESDGSLSPYFGSICAEAEDLTPSSDPKDPGLAYGDARRLDGRKKALDGSWATLCRRCRFNFPSITYEEKQLRDDEVAKRRMTSASRIAKMQVILLSDYLNGKRNWQPVERWRIETHQPWSEDNWKRANANTAFTPRVALRTLDKNIMPPRYRTMDEAIREHLRPLMEDFIRQHAELDTWDRQRWDEMGHGGYFMRAFLDVTGDGRPEMFLTTSFETDDRANSTWRIYDLAKDGSVSPYSDTILEGFTGLGPPVDGSKSGFVKFSWPRWAEKAVPEEQQMAHLMRFNFMFPEIRFSSTDIPVMRAEELERAAHGRYLHPEGILISDFLAGKRDWSIPKKWNYISGALQREDDWERAKVNTAFTPEAAWKAINKPTNNSPKKTAKRKK